jgi:acetoin utilization protein AcuB
VAPHLAAFVQRSRGMKVRDVMRPIGETVRPDTPLRTAAATMRAAGVEQIAVTDEGGRLVGMLTDRDLRHAELLPGLASYLPWEERRLLAPRVRDVMTWSVVTVDPNTDLARAGLLMFERRVGTLPVVEGQRVVGLLTEADVLRALQQARGETGPPELYLG